MQTQLGGEVRTCIVEAEGPGGEGGGEKCCLKCCHIDWPI